MDIKFTKGDLVRWITGHSVYEADELHLVGSDPIYSYGIVMEVSHKDPKAIIVNSCLKNAAVRLVVLNGADEQIEILSAGAVKNG